MARRVIIWPDLYREQGHWLPNINLAKSLKDAGYSVEFMGIRDCQGIVSPYGGKFTSILESIYPLGYSAENKLEPLDQRWKPHHVLPICRGALDPIFLPPPGTPKPDLLVSGYFTALETLLIHHKYGTPFVLTTTFLRHPRDKPELHAKTKLVYMQAAVVQAIMDKVTDDAAVKADLDSFVAPLASAPELIPCPREFDFTDRDWHHRDSTVSYVEPMILRAPLDATTPPITDPVPVPAGKKLIFATAGSQVQDYEGKALSFFKNMIAMMQTQGMDQYYLAMAVGERLNARLNIEYAINLGKAMPQNVVWFDWVSQLDVMQQASVVFMHGGLATIKESIWEEVPIVIVPLGKDQIDNANRIRRARVGVVSEVADLSPEDLRKLLTAATGDTFIRRNLKSLATVFRTAENNPTRASVTIIKSVVAPS